MKIYKNIFKNTISLESLLLAWDRFKKGKKKRLDVQQFEYKLEDNIWNLHQDLVSKRYMHYPYSNFHIHDPKIRSIHKAHVRDRVVHHALYESINPIFEPTFIFDSYSCRKSKGTHKAVKRLNYFLESTYRKENRCYALKCDIKKFFESIDHKILNQIITSRIKDPNMIWLINEIIQSFSSEAKLKERE